MRIKFVKPFEFYPSGKVADLPKTKAELLIKQGIAVISKDMSREDIKQS
jgi:hypothetical protein